jgi:aarF domain-containing kinase
VQHNRLRETSTGDVDAVSAMVAVLSWAFPRMPLWWLADEIAPNLPIELDFTREADNARRCRELFAADARVHVPQVLGGLSSTRVLTMSFEEGVRVDDVAALARMRLSTSAVSSLVRESFSRQIFEAGFVHCDPHPANVLVRCMPAPPPPPPPSLARLPTLSSLLAHGAPRPQLVLLDHGLYRELDAQFTKDYCLLWRALVSKSV